MTAIKKTMMSWRTPFISIDERRWGGQRWASEKERQKRRKTSLYTLLWDALPPTDWTHFGCFAFVSLATTCCTWLLHYALLCLWLSGCGCGCGCHWTTPTALSAIWVALDAWRLFKSRRQQAGDDVAGSCCTCKGSTLPFWPMVAVGWLITRTATHSHNSIALYV